MAEERTKKIENNKGEDDKDMDTGYSWIILLGSFVILVLLLGSMKSFGVLYTEMLDNFSAGSGNTAWIGSLAWLLLHSLAPLVNVLTRRFSFRLISFVGGILIGCGYFLSGFVNRMELMYLTFTIVGFGNGLSYASSFMIISFYFKKRRTLANGIMASSAGIGLLSFPYLYRFLLDKYGLSQGFWIIGAILSNICVASCVFRQPKRFLKTQDISPLENGADQGQPKSIKSQYGTIKHKFALLKNRRFALLLIALTLSTVGHSSNNIIIPAHIKALGYSNTFVTIGVSISGGAEVIARIVIGWFADLNIIEKVYIFVICTFVGGIFALIAPLFDSFTFMAVYAGVIGAFPSSFYALISVLAIERVGIDNFQTAVGFIAIFMALAFTISLPVSGWLADYYGNWNASFMFSGVALTCAGVTALLEKAIIRFCANKNYSLEKVERNSLKGPKLPESVELEFVSRDNIL